MRAALVPSRRLITSATTRTTIRHIAIGTDLTENSSSLSWQSSRPWHMDGTSNKAVDNAVSLKDLFSNKTVAVFGVPAPFTGTCTQQHYPPYKKLADDFFKEGVDSIVCYSVADPYAHHHWAKSLDNDFDKISFMADPDASWAKAYNLDRDYSDSSLGLRSARFSILVKDGIVKSFNVVEDASEDAEVLLDDAKKS